MCETIGEGPGYFNMLCDLAVKARVTGSMAHDARIAAICLHNGVAQLLSCDRDFSRFGRLKILNPILSR